MEKADQQRILKRETEVLKESAHYRWRDTVSAQFDHPIHACILNTQENVKTISFGVCRPLVLGMIQS